MERDRLCPKCKIAWDSEKLGRECPKCDCSSFFTMRSGDIGVAIYVEQSGLNYKDFATVESKEGMADEPE